MQKVFRNFMAVVLVGAFAVTGCLLAPELSQAQEPLAKVQAVSCPSLLLKHWKDSSQQEKLAFLFGFVTMLEMEKEWQGDKPLALSYSINRTWIRGLDGVTLGHMIAALDNYIAQNPDRMEQSVISTLGRIYVAPKLTAEEREEAAAHYRSIKANK